jgi:hypothetical protein
LDESVQYFGDYVEKIEETVEETEEKCGIGHSLYLGNISSSHVVAGNDFGCCRFGCGR